MVGMPLNMTRIAFGCADLAELEARITARAAVGEVRMTTRYRPRRAEEMIGGSLYWIIAHQIVARSEIIAFADSGDGRTDIVVGSRLIPVRPRPKRAHQGWRYLEGDAVPVDLDSNGADMADMPAALRAELASMGLV